VLREEGEQLKGGAFVSQEKVVSFAFSDSEAFHILMF